MNRLTKALAAEFIGTFALIFIGAGAVTALGSAQMTAIALAHGLTIMVFASAFGDIHSATSAAATLIRRLPSASPPPGSSHDGTSRLTLSCKSREPLRRATACSPYSVGR